MASLCKNFRLARHGASYISRRLGAMRTFSSNSPLLKTRPLQQVKSQSPSNARILGSKAFYSVVPQTGDSVPEVLKAPLACKLFQVDSFSKLQKFEVEKLELGKFEAGGHKWSLTIHPALGYDSDYFSDDEMGDMLVRLGLADTSALPEDWELDAVYSVCLKNQTNGSYYRTELGRAHFTAKETECDAFIPTQLLRDPDAGYVKDDTCVFGAEFFVNKKDDVVTEKVCLNHLKHPAHKQEFEIPDFPNMEEGGWITHQTWTSEEFSAGGHQWKLKVSPKGWEEGTGRLSVFLEQIVDDDEETSCADASFSIILRGYSDVVKYTCTGRFSESGGYHRGWNSFIDLVTLFDPDKGFIKNGCLKVELDLTVNDSIPSSVSSHA